MNSGHENQDLTQSLPRRRKICVIGAGLTGLTAARRLLDLGYDVTLLESTLQAGGMVASFDLGNEQVEYIHHHTCAGDCFLDGLAEELGLRDQIIWRRVRHALYSGDVLIPLSTTFQLLNFSRIPFRQRLRTGLALRKAVGLRNWPNLESQTAAAWLRRECGDLAYDHLWRPLLHSRFGPDSEEISAVWVRSSFLSGKLPSIGWRGTGRLGYMKGGFGVMASALVRSITERKGRVLYGHTAMNISREPSAEKRPGYRVACILEDCTSVEVDADAVIATISGRQFASITSDLAWPDTYLKQVRGIRYKGGLCLILRLRKRLSKYYWTTVGDDLPFTVVVEQTNLHQSGRYGGNVAYLTSFLDVTDPLWTQSDGSIFRLFTQGLARMYPSFNPSDIMDWRLRRTRYAQPVISREFSARVPALDTPEPGVKLGGTAQVYPEACSMNFAIRLGSDAAQSIHHYFENIG